MELGSPSAFNGKGAAVFERAYGERLSSDIGTRASFLDVHPNFIEYLTDTSATSLWNIPPHEKPTNPSFPDSPVVVPDSKISDIIKVFEQDPTLFVGYVLAQTGNIKEKHDRQLIWSLTDLSSGDDIFDAHPNDFTSWWDQNGKKQEARSVGAIAFTVTEAGGVTNVGRIYLLEKTDKSLTLLARMCSFDCPMVSKTFSTNTMWHFEQKGDGVVFTPKSWWYSFKYFFSNVFFQFK